MRRNSSRMRKTPLRPSLELTRQRSRTLAEKKPAELFIEKPSIIKEARRYSPSTKDSYSKDGRDSLKKRKFDRATRRVLAPFVHVPITMKEDEENEMFTYYLDKKPELLMKDLTYYLSDSVDLESVLLETIQSIKKKIKADGSNLYMVDIQKQNISLVTSCITHERNKLKWTIREGTTVAAYCAFCKQPVLVENGAFDKTYPWGVAYNEMVNTVLCLPILSSIQETYAVMEFYKYSQGSPITLEDMDFAAMVTTWISAAIYHNAERLAAQKQKELSDYLLDLTNCYYSDKAVSEKMITEIVKFAQVTLGAQKASFYILDKDAEKQGKELVADLFYNADDEPPIKKSIKVKLSNEREIATIVATTGVTFNIRDACDDDRFIKEVDQVTGDITRSVLCMPIVGIDGILGVVQARNKKDGSYFNPSDETLFNTFSVYCALALYYTRAHSHLTKKTSLKLLHQKLMHQILKPCSHDMNEFVNNPHTKIPKRFHTYSWHITHSTEANLHKLILYMFLKTIGSSFIILENTIQFILEVKNMYRNEGFHTFQHAFYCTHLIYNILRRNENVFTRQERKVLLIASLCHHMDYQYTSNRYLELINDDRACLYEDSPQENYKYLLIVEILENCKIFRFLTPVEYQSFLSQIKELILACDYLRHFKIRSALKKLLLDKEFSWDNETHRYYLKCILMTITEFNHVTKPFYYARKMVYSFFNEYFDNQYVGEVNAGKSPVLKNDNQFSIIQEEINYLSLIVIPCLDILRVILPNTKDICKAAIDMRYKWRNILDIKDQKIWRKEDSIVKSDLFLL